MLQQEHAKFSKILKALAVLLKADGSATSVANGFSAVLAQALSLTCDVLDGPE